MTLRLWLRLAALPAWAHGVSMSSANLTAVVASTPGPFLSAPILPLVRIVYLRIRKSRLATRVVPETTLTV